MLFYINETNLEQEKIRNCKKRQRRRESPHGGWGMGSKEPIRRKFLLYVVTISVKLSESSWFLYKMKLRSYKLPKIKITVKRETRGGIRMIQKPLSNNRFSSLCYAY